MGFDDDPLSSSLTRRGVPIIGRFAGYPSSPGELMTLLAKTFSSPPMVPFSFSVAFHPAIKTAGNPHARCFPPQKSSCHNVAPIEDCALPPAGNSWGSPSLPFLPLLVTILGSVAPMSCSIAQSRWVYPLRRFPSGSSFLREGPVSARQAL